MNDACFDPVGCCFSNEIVLQARILNERKKAEDAKKAEETKKLAEQQQREAELKKAQEEEEAKGHAEQAAKPSGEVVFTCKCT